MDTTKITALTGSQRQALVTARDSYGLDVDITQTTATFPQEPATAAALVTEAKDRWKMDGGTVSDTRPLAFAARKLLAQA